MKKYFASIMLVFIVMTFIACDKNNPHAPNTVPNPVITLSDMRNLFDGEDVKLEPKKMWDAHMITGVVISDATSGNIPKGEIVIQNLQRGLTAGITISLGDQTPVTFMPGDSVDIELTGGTLARKNGILEITGLTANSIKKIKENSEIKPVPVSIEQLTNNFSIYESTLVQVIGAHFFPAPAVGETFSGNKELRDDAGLAIQLHTEENAAFAKEELPENAQFTGIARYYNEAKDDTIGAVRQLWMRNLSDAAVSSSPIYAFFPEDFNTTLEKNAYAIDNLELKSGNWTFDGVTLVTITSARPINPDGTKGVQFNQKNTSSLFLQMNFDVPSGASKVTLLYGSYGTDPGCTWRLEYSTDGGATWSQTGDDIIANNKTSQTATFTMDIAGPVRFRVNKLGLGASNNGRLNIDDIAIFKN